MRKLFRRNRDGELAEALAASLDALRNGTSTVDDCLRRFPALAAELQPLLHTAARLEALGRAEPPEAARLTARRAFLDAAAARSRPAPVAPRPVVHRRGWLVFAPVGVAAALFLAIALPVLGSMDTGAVPGDWNYAFKRSTERVRLALTVDPNDRRVLRLEFAQRRLNEIEKLSNNGQSNRHPNQVTALLKDYTADLNQVAPAAASLPASAQQQKDNLAAQAQPLLTELQTVPADNSVKAAASDAANATTDLAKNAPAPAANKGNQGAANRPSVAQTSPTPVPTEPPTQAPRGTPAPSATPTPEPPTPTASATATPPPLTAASLTPQPTAPPVPTRSAEVLTPVPPTQPPTAAPTQVRTPPPTDTAPGTAPAGAAVASSTRGATLPTQTAGTETPTVTPSRTPTQAPATAIATRAATVVPATLELVVAAPGQSVYRWNGGTTALDAALTTLTGSYSVVYYPDATGQVKAWYPGTPAPTIGPGTLVTVMLKQLTGR